MQFYRFSIAFVLCLLAIVVMPLCHSSTLIDWHHSDGHKLRVEINNGTDPQSVSQWQLSLLLPESFDDQNSMLCFKTPVVSADSGSIAIMITNNPGDYCYQLVILNRKQTTVFQQTSKNGTLVRLKSTTADRPELAYVSPHQLLNSKNHTTPLTLLTYPDNMTESGLESGQTRNNTVALAGDKLAGNADFPGGGNGGFFYSFPPPPWGGRGGWPSGLFEIDLLVLKPVITWLMFAGKDSISFEAQPSPARLKITRVNADGSSSEAVISVSWLDFLSIEQLTDVHFWNTLFQRASSSCPLSENLQWQLGCLKLFLERTALKTHHAGGLKAGNGDGEPSDRLPDRESKDENNDHQKEQKFEPEDQESRSPGESDKDTGGGDKRKDDNGEESEKNAPTQDLQELANQLIAIIESDHPDAALLLRQIMDELDMPHRLQLLETIGTNNRGHSVTPLEAALELQRSFKENSSRNSFIKQLIEATSNKTRTLNDFDIPTALQQILPAGLAMPEPGNNNLRILYKIVEDIIHKVNQSGTQPPIGDFEKSCFTEYFVQLFLLYANPFGPVIEVLGKISDQAICRDIMTRSQSFTFPGTFLEIIKQFVQHPSSDALVHFSNSLVIQLQPFSSSKEPLLQKSSLQELAISNSGHTSNKTMASHGNAYTDSIQPLNGHDIASDSSNSLKPSNDKYLQQGAKPKQRVLADRSNDSSQKRLHSLPPYVDYQTKRAQDRPDREARGVNPNFLNRHSTNRSLLVEQPYSQTAIPAQTRDFRERTTPPLMTSGNTFNTGDHPEDHELQNLERSLEKLEHAVNQYRKDGIAFEPDKIAREREDKKRQQIKELTAQVQSLITENQGLRIENQKLTIEKQHLSAENQELTIKNQELERDNNGLRGCVECFESDSRRLEAELQITKDKLIQQRSMYDETDQAYHQMTATSNPLMPGNNIVRRTSQQQTIIQNEAASPLNDQPNTDNVQVNPSDEQSLWSNEEFQQTQQESRKPVCKHYQRFCYVGFACCPGYFPCQRCHNEDEDSCETEVRAVQAMRLKCSLCGYEGEITENSQICPGCDEQMCTYYCAKCKHFTSMEKKPFHCDKCGVCRIHADKSFHCDVCGVCLDKRLDGNHKCRLNSGHDECCICLEDAFSGCQILPCSHKVHRECAIAMYHNGIRTCPVCRQPFSTQQAANND
ncbi:CHY zinc finger protein [Endozoicomonas sp. SESOKO2]|uniref:CHY zinc finger protein n=1 Tax=Endozoicomonas sp. SESOKO2 TaxID=2828743 RepID=UPI0021482554|nr:CHY zinc finger protein [Endozoicomonas sp. SESOKO2]